MFKNLSQFVKKIALKSSELFVVLLLFPASSFAADITSVIEKATGYLQGGLAKSIGVAAIVIAGYLCISKQMFPKMFFMMILVGLGLIFGASSLYQTFIG